MLAVDVLKSSSSMICRNCFYTAISGLGIVSKECDGMAFQIVEVHPAFALSLRGWRYCSSNSASTSKIMGAKRGGVAI